MEAGRRRCWGVAVALTALATGACTSPITATDSTDIADARSRTKRQEAVGEVGSTITLGGASPGVKVAVTLIAFAPMAAPADEFTRPAPGRRFAAVQVRLRNLADAPYQESPLNSAKLLDAKGQSFPPYLASDMKLGPGFPAGTVNISPGETALGVLAFGVPKDATITRFQFSTESGFGDIGEWRVNQLPAEGTVDAADTRLVARSPQSIGSSALSSSAAVTGSPMRIPLSGESAATPGGGRS